MKTSVRFALVPALAAIVLVSGCGIEKLPLTPHEVAKLASKFENVTRNELRGNDTEGRTYELIAESRRNANWNDADYAMWMALQHSCPDGRQAATISWSPDGRTQAQRSVVHPEGTVFRRVITCPAAPEFEFALEDGLSRREVQGVFYERLNAGIQGFPRDPTLLPVRFSQMTPKYPAIEQALGRATLEAIEKCGGAATLSGVAVGVLPSRPANPESGERRHDAWVGYLLDCQQP